jgi:integral membrane sensor domain MASE1
LVTWILAVALALSVCANVYALYWIRNKLKTRPQSVELREFLADVMQGAGMVKVSMVDPDRLMVWSPRAMP